MDVLLRPAARMRDGTLTRNKSLKFLVVLELQSISDLQLAASIRPQSPDVSSRKPWPMHCHDYSCSYVTRIA